MTTLAASLPSIWDDPRFDFPAELDARVPDARIPWQRASFVTRCPMPDHADRHPSCSMTLRDGVWLVCCHGCGFAGDGVDLLATLDSMTAPEWLRARTQRHTLLPLRPRRRRPTPPPPSARFTPLCTPEELDGYVAACHAALLDGTGSALVRRYARSRGLTGEEVRDWRIGYGVATSLPKLDVLAGRLVFPCPGGAEGRAVDGQQPKYRSANMTTACKVPFGVERVSPKAGPLVLAEGVFDVLALRRAEVQAIGLRGKTIAAPVAERLRTLGFDRAHIALDTDAPAEAILSLARVLAAAGIAPHHLQGPPAGDFGDLLTRPVEELLGVVGDAMAMVT